MPNEVTLLIERLSVVVTLGLPDIAITPLECVGLGGYRPRLLFWMIAPVAVDIVIVLCVLLLLTWKGRCCAPRTRRTPGTAAVATRRGSSLSRWLARQSLGAPAALPPPPTASVANKAEQKTLVHKALPAVLVSLFVLYPKVTLVAFEGFPCYEFVVSSTETRHFLRADVGIDCDSDEWEQVALLAWAAIVLYPIGMWVATAVMLRTASHSIANGKKTAFSSAISFVYQEYNVTTYWWELMEMLRKFLLVGVMVLVEPGTLLQISIGTIFCAVYLLIQLQARPYLSRADGFLADVSSFSLLMVYFCCTIYKFGMLTGSDDLQLSLEQRQKYTIPGTAFSAILFLSVLGSLFFAGVLVAVQTAFEMKRVLSPTWGANLPTCEWHMKPGQEFSCFLSHYKAEAGAEARYLKDSLDKMLSCPAYLDSSTLADLRELFRSGVRQSEVLVLLLSQGVLTRPWCLLEIREAVRLQKPIVLLELKGPGQSFSFDAAFELMSDLESNLPPWAVDELCAHLKEEPLSELQDTLRKALETGRAAGVPHFNINGTANQLEAELLGLVERLAAATGRTVEWKGGNLLVDKRPSAQKRTSDRAQRHATRRFRSGTRKRPVSDAPGGTYIIHEPDAERHARRLQEGMDRACAEPCHLEVPSSPDEMERCLERVAQSASVMLLQTRAVLEQPWALLAVFRAALASVPVVCVVVDESGYDFGGAKLHLEHLNERLAAPALEQLADELSRWGPPRAVAALQSKLASQIPQIISVAYKPNGTDHELMATIRDVEDKRRLLQAQRRTCSMGTTTSISTQVV